MSNFVEKKSIFEGMTMSQMKDAYSKMTAKERGQFAGAFVRAAKTAKKPAKPKAKTKQQQTRTPSKPTKPTASDQEVKGDSPKNGKSGTSGKLRPNNPPSPTVRRKGSTTGATVDPRERSLRKNLQESKSRKGSTVKGRKNIAAQVEKASGSSKRNQKLVEARRRRAREEALKKNLREMFGSKYNN